MDFGRDAFGFFHWFKETRWTRLSMLGVCLVGIAYGFYYYTPQFAETPVWLWLFVPDSPLAVMWAFLALAIYGFGKRSDVLDSLAFVANVQVGLWTSYVLLAYWDHFEIGTLNLNFVLFWGHLGMVALALVFVRDLRRSFRSNPGARWRVLGGVAAWVFFNDVVDYLGFRGYYHADCGLRPYTVPCGDPTMEAITGAVTFGLSAITILALAWFTRRPPPTQEAYREIPVRAK